MKTIGRFEFYKIEGMRDWSIEHPPCKCIILSLGRYGFTVRHNECRCDACKCFECKCPPDVAPPVDGS